MSAPDDPLVADDAVVEVRDVDDDHEAAADDDGERRWTPRPALLGAAAFLVYLVLAILQWGLPVMTHFSTRYLTRFRADPDFYRWALAWTPWALLHGHDPLYSHYVFAPGGIDLTWSALIPGPAIVMWPITHLFGSVASSNTLKLLSFSLAGWGAYLVCHRLTKAFWPSLLGGYLFGFSTYMVGQGGHLNLILIFPIPLLVYLAIRHVEGSMGTPTFIALTALGLLGLFSISTELFGTTVLFGGIAYLLALIFAGKDRIRVVKTALFTAVAYVIVGAAIFVPYLLPAIRNTPDETLHPLARASADLLGFVVPRPDILIRFRPLAHISNRFSANLYEDASYIGIALVLMLIGFGITERRRRGTWALLLFVLIVSILSLGPVLHIEGRLLFQMPGALVAKIPLLKNATAQRWPMYSSLAIGVIAAIWVARGDERFGWIRWMLVIIGALMLLPHNPPDAGYPYDRTPTFFTQGTYRTVLHPDDNVLLIVGSRGEEMLWQSEADFAFKMPQGYTGPLPPALRNEQLFRGLAVEGTLVVIPTPEELQKWMTTQQVTAVVMVDTAAERYGLILRQAGLKPVYRGGGVSVWRMPEGP